MSRAFVGVCDLATAMLNARQLTRRAQRRAKQRQTHCTYINVLVPVNNGGPQSVTLGLIFPRPRPSAAETQNEKCRLFSVGQYAFEGTFSSAP